MSLLRVVCPSCASEQTSPHGFVPGEVVRCRRCDASFKVPNRVTASLADDPAAPPERKHTVLYAAAVLVVVAVIGTGLYAAVVVAKRERAERAEAERELAEMKMADAREEAAARLKAAKAKGNRGDANPLAGLLGGSAPLTAEQAKKSAEALAAKLVGVWAGPGREIEYKADGTFRDGPHAGTWKATGAKGTKVLTLERSAGRSPVRVTFEGDELIHDSDERGVSHALKKK